VAMRTSSRAQGGCKRETKCEIPKRFGPQIGILGACYSDTVRLLKRRIGADAPANLIHAEF